MATRNDGPPGMHLSADHPTRSVRRTPDGRLIIGGDGHDVGRDADAERRYTALARWTSERFGVTSFEHRWSAQDHHPVDGLPYVSRLDRAAKRRWVATAFRIWGMNNGTVAAMILADALTGAESPWGWVFDATRVEAIRSAPRFVKENAAVACRLVGDRLATARRPDEAATALGLASTTTG